MRLGLGLGIVKSAASIYKGFLDKFPNAVAAYSTRKLKTSYPTTLPADYGAVAAYSLRKVKSDYEGSAVKVRRSSDNELQDIGFDSNGNLDTTALLAFVNTEHTIADEDFSTDPATNGWTYNTGATWSADVLPFVNSSSSSAAYKNFGLFDRVGLKIRVSFTISNYSGSGTIRFIKYGATFLETSNQGGTQRSANGTYTEELTFSGSSVGNVNWGFWTSSNFTGEIDDFEVVQITADGTVNILYDQTGNNDLSNSTASQQPQIVVAGSVTTKGGETALKFNDVEFLQKTSATTNWVAESNLSIFSVFSVTDYTAAVDADRQVLYNISGDEVASARGDTVVAMVRNDQMRIGFYEETVGWGETQGFQSPPDDTQILTSSIYDSSSTLTSTLNGSTNGTVVSNPEANRAANTITIGSLHNGAKSLTGYVQEFVVLNSDQSTNRKDIEWNINNHYSIYDQWDRESCMNVRRSSDNATQDIGFSGKNINQTQLESFVNAERDIFTSAFSSGTTAGSGDGDITSITMNLTAPSSIGGQTDALQAECNGGSAPYDFRVRFLDNGQQHDVSFEYYIPSGNTILEGIRFTDLSGVGTFTTKGAWTSVTLTDKTATNNILRFFAASSSGSSSIGSGVTESFYIRNLSVSQTTADGHVTTFYDQSGNGNNATNATESEQPLVVSGGSVVQFDGINAIQFDGTSHELTTSLSLSTTAFSSFSVAGTDGVAGTNAQAIFGSNATAFYSQIRSYDLETRISSSPILTLDDDIGNNPNQMQLFASINGTSQGNQYIDGTIGNRSPLDTSTSGGISETSVYIGSANGQRYLGGGISEIILFASDQSGNRTDIEKNINTHFKIYS